MHSLKLVDLKSYEKHILTILCIRADEKTLECWPSIKCLVCDSGLDEKTVQQAILSLLQKKLIIRTGEMKGKTKRTPVYKMNFNTPVNGCVQNLNTPVYPVNTPSNGGVKYPRIRGLEGKDLKDIKKDVFAHANSTSTPTSKATQDTFMDYQNYVGRTKADITLKIIPSDTQILTAQQFENRSMLKVSPHVGAAK
jgi:pyocin large subunit-like protein